MAAFVAFLRGINVGGKHLVSMSWLRGVFTELGFSEVQTVLQSGSVVFSGTVPDANLLETEIHRRLGVSIDVLIRSGEQMKVVAARNPFGDQAQTDPAHVLVMFTKERAEANYSELSRFCTAGEKLEIAAGHLYLYYPSGIGTSKLTGAVIERYLGTRGTARNWNTVLRIQKLLSANGA